MSIENGFSSPVTVQFSCPLGCIMLPDSAINQREGNLDGAEWLFIWVEHTEMDEISSLLHSWSLEEERRGESKDCQRRRNFRESQRRTKTNSLRVFWCLDLRRLAIVPTLMDSRWWGFLLLACQWDFRSGANRWLILCPPTKQTNFKINPDATFYIQPRSSPCGRKPPVVATR